VSAGDGAIDVIVLAGDRGPADPLAMAAGAPGKVLVEIDGQSLLSRVLETVGQLRGLRRVVLLAPLRDEYRAAVPAGLECMHLRPADGPAASVAAALAHVATDALVVTADHPLLRAAWLETFIAEARAAGADAAVGVADAGAVQRCFPGMRRTAYRFADTRACGTNLFFFGGPGGQRIARSWADFERDRKRPWRIVARLGVLNLARYLLGRMTLARAMRALSDRLGARLVAVAVGAPEAAVDVDTPADLEWVRTILAERRRAAR